MTTPRTLPNRAAFLLGMSISVLPAVGPFAAALLLLSRRWRLKRRDVLWASAALLFGLGAGVAGGWADAATGLATVAGPWLVFRTFEEFKGLGALQAHARWLGLGLLTGFAAVIVVGLATSVQGVAFDASRTLAQAIVWQGSPAVFGHAVLVMGGVIALVARSDPRVSLAAMALAAVGILVSGSLEAAVAWLVLAVLQIATRDADARRRRTLEWLVLTAMLAVAAGLAPVLGWGRIGFLVSPGDDATAGRNLLVGTEVPRGDWWDDRWVDVETSEVAIDRRLLTAYEVRKRGDEDWLRLQQPVRLRPGTAYTLSGWIAAGDGAVPAFLGWAQRGDQAGTIQLDARLIDDAPQARLVGPGRILAADVTADRDGWRRLTVAFEFEDGEPLTWFVGFAPDARPGEGVASTVAGLQLEAGAVAGPYQPGLATRGLAFGYARAPIWRVALDAIAERPLFGWGRDAFAGVYRQAHPAAERLQVVPGHPHNQLLTTAFASGLVGVGGLVLLFVALFGLAVRYRDLGLLSLGLAVLIANSFDATLLSGSVLYPLAAVAGWRGSRRGARRSEGAEGARQLVVRFALSLGDAASAFVALLAVERLAPGAFELGASHLYALLAWPAMAWREGLYPGYGLTPAQELKKQVAAAALAAGLFVAGAAMFPASLGVPAVALAAFVTLATLAGPVARAGTKRLLHAMRLWGRPVVILGAGTTGRRVARALGRTPLDGLHPLAFFDDDPTLHGRRLDRLRVRGALDDAHAFAARHHVRHAIVAIPQLDAGRLDRLVTGSGRAFRRVQFVPQLGGLPSNDVVATDLDGMLALEVRNGLYAPANRLAKRATDLVGASLALAALSPLLGVLWLLVRLDSFGGALHASERIGQNGRPFACIKFRSMHVDAERRLREMLASDPGLRAEYDRWHKLEDDPRVTRVGRWLRRTSLDELPQLWNVLRGEMSLVGPRPYLARELPAMGAYADIILQAKPGITGHWQVSARNTVSFAERLEMEAHYVRNWSVWWDVILTVQTPLVVLRNEGEAK